MIEDGRLQIFCHNVHGFLTKLYEVQNNILSKKVHYYFYEHLVTKDVTSGDFIDNKCIELNSSFLSISN